jgi:GLPGLI family protein
MRVFVFIGMIFISLVTFSAVAQKKEIEKAAIITYQSSFNGQVNNDAPAVILETRGNSAKVYRPKPTVQQLIPGYATDITYLDYSKELMYSSSSFDDCSSYYGERLFSDMPKVEFTDDTKVILGYTCKKATTVINSNRIDIWYNEQLGLNGTPQPGVGNVPGLVLSVVRNGNSEITASKIEQLKQKKLNNILIPANLGEKVEMSRIGDIKRQKMVLRYPVFKNEQICWGKENSTAEEFVEGKVYHYAGGTLILKKVKLPELPQHYSVFAEISQYSNGDAYDRTGSVFVIPRGRELSFLDGLVHGLDKLPVYIDKDSLAYQGVALTAEYEPLVELVRFFTSFGVRQYNDRVKIENIVWEDSSLYKQDITDLKSYLEGEVLVGAFIGNYDGGGHKLSLDICYYPGSYEWDLSTRPKSFSLPLFNTCNVMEMGGQRYGTMFNNDSLTVTFDVPEGAKNLKLRYITTGHGGWGGGDEFNQKLNEIFIDGQRVFAFIPWRTDCAAYRKWNPASGNFWNGLSSSDLSRSGWCPGSVTNPEYILLPDLKPGRHTLKVAIPLGTPEGSSFSAWSVSGLLLGDF